MQLEERERFLVWYAEMTKKNTVFDFQREIVTHCRTDVDILRRACLSFRKIFLERGNVCPFVECTTIASTCMKIFRKNFLRKKEIGIIPTGGYKMNDNQSRKAVQWLILKEREIGRCIIHAGHCREYRLTEGMLVDGYYECENGETQRHVLQFHGCFFHGCGLFAGYINTFLQLKQEASGWPSEYEGDEIAKERYLREYETTEGVVLDKNNTTRNPGLRSVAKLGPNSFWGKFGQRTNLANTEIVRTCQRFAELLSSPEHEIIGILPVNDEVMYVSWRLRREAVVPSPINTVAIAAFTTAQARLKLYEYLEKLNRRVLYYDTDLCIYTSSGDPDDYEPRTGNFLGDITDELVGNGHDSFIETFVSSGPKFYAYVVRTPDGRQREICKIKGIKLVVCGQPWSVKTNPHHFTPGVKTNPLFPP
ncbi:putative DNA polymerase [Trachymyrmex cornetzi]|uniref:Putative DNA polymerase n=1 Tax=Trachymyrmex cornetzi TaxID=471704 RepID=A0A151J671_9HYME|nr:putative DNA polymerase [Trachymyrmex cornetzi]